MPKRRRIVVEELEDARSAPAAPTAPTAPAAAAVAAAWAAAPPAAAAAAAPGSAAAPPLDSAVALVDWVFRDVDSYAIARAGRAELEAALDTKLSSLTYGEISVSPFVQLLRSLPEPAAPPHFIDIGSGTGKAVLAAALARPLASASGVELVPQLHSTAVRAERALRQLLAQLKFREGELPPGLPVAEATAARERLQELGGTNLRLRCGDSFKAAGGGSGLPEWVCRLCPLPPQEPAGVAWIYAPCTVFDPGMMAVLHGFLERLLPGSIVITTTQKLPPLDVKSKRGPKTKGKRRAPAVQQQRQHPRPGVRCRLVLQSSTSMSYAKGRLIFHVYHALEPAGSG